MKAGIRDRTVDYIVSENFWPLFLYEKYMVNYGNLEQGLFKSKILVQVSRLGIVVTVLMITGLGFQSYIHITLFRKRG